jgi:hypothetical protein
VIEITSANKAVYPTTASGAFSVGALLAKFYVIYEHLTAFRSWSVTLSLAMIIGYV